MQTGTTQHYSAISLFSLNRNLDKVLPIISQMITEPSMPIKPFEVLKQQRIQQLEINRQKVSFLAAEAFNSLIFGASHPYARTTSAQDLQAVTLDDLCQYHHDYYQNTGIHIILSGRITNEVLDLVHEHLDSLTPAATTPAVVARITPEDTHTTFIHRPDALQSG
jgi:predicted Zn-dependent peptidase